MTKLTDEQIHMARVFETRAFASFYDQEKFDKVMDEFEEWKKKEGVEI